MEHLSNQIKGTYDILFQTYIIDDIFLSNLISLIIFTYRSTIENWKMVFNQGEYKLTALIILIVPFMLCLKPDQEWVNPRDLAGMYVLIASFDINLAIRDLLTDRNTAAMITWTEVVFYSMWKFLKVNLKICSCALDTNQLHFIYNIHRYSKMLNMNFFRCTL